MILITGAAGFIGSCLVDSFGDEDVISCDVARKEMLTPEECVLFLKNPTHPVNAVYHLGAISSTTTRDVVKLTDNNIRFSAELMELCITRGIPFIYASSASVYGLANTMQKETDSVAPLNYYAISKTAFDMYALQKMKDHPSSHIIGLRYFNVYGHREHDKGDQASPVHKFITQARSTGEIKIFEGSDDFLRDFVYIDDVVSITRHAPKLRQNGIYNVGTGVARSFKAVAAIIARACGADIVEIPFPEHLKNKYQTYTCSDNTKITSAGYIMPRLGLEAGIKKVLQEV